MTTDIEIAKQALVSLEREKQAQRDRLQLAARAKQQLSSTSSPALKNLQQNNL